MIGALSSRSSLGLTAFTLPCAPTGMNAGVSIAPCPVVSRPCRAPDSRSFVKSSKFFSIEKEVFTCCTKCAPAHKIFFATRDFLLYSRGSPHQARDSVLTRLGGFFCRPDFDPVRAALCLEQNAHD